MNRFVQVMRSSGRVSRTALKRLPERENESTPSKALTICSPKRARAHFP